LSGCGPKRPEVDQRLTAESGKDSHCAEEQAQRHPPFVGAKIGYERFQNMPDGVPGEAEGTGPVD